MGKAGVGLIKGIDVEEIVDRLDSYYCYNLVVMHFSYALHNRLEGQAAFLLGNELEENAEQSHKAARKLADRIGDLGGAVSADPTLFVERSPLAEFSLPASNSEVGIILGFVLERIRMIIGEYEAFFIALGRASTTVPSISMTPSFLAISSANFRCPPPGRRAGFQVFQFVKRRNGPVRVHHHRSWSGEGSAWSEKCGIA